MNARIYVINRVFSKNHKPMRGHPFEQEILPKAFGMACLQGRISEGNSIDIGVPADHAKANREFVNG